MKVTIVGLSFISLFLSGACAAEPNAAAPAFEETLKIDIHSHIFEDMPELVDMMRRINLHIVNICVRGTQPELLKPMEQTAEFLHEKYPQRFSFASTSPFLNKNLCAS